MISVGHVDDLTGRQSSVMVSIEATSSDHERVGPDATGDGVVTGVTPQDIVTA